MCLRAKSLHDGMPLTVANDFVGERVPTVGLWVFVGATLANDDVSPLTTSGRRPGRWLAGLSCFRVAGGVGELRTALLSVGRHSSGAISTSLAAGTMRATVVRLIGAGQA